MMIIYICKSCGKQYRLHSTDSSNGEQEGNNNIRTESILCYQCETYKNIK